MSPCTYRKSKRRDVQVSKDAVPDQEAQGEYPQHPS